MQKLLTALGIIAALALVMSIGSHSAFALTQSSPQGSNTPALTLVADSFSSGSDDTDKGVVAISFQNQAFA